MGVQKTTALTPAEAKEPFADYYHRENAGIPHHVIDDIRKSPYPAEKALPLEKINDLLNPEYLPLENRYCHMTDGGVFVAVLTLMPGVTGDMLDWWFWWHPLSPLRQKIIKKLLLPKNVGIAMDMHCAQEYHNLAKILPKLYNQYTTKSSFKKLARPVRCRMI